MKKYDGTGQAFLKSIETARRKWQAKAFLIYD
jgi:hypothetical protein